MSDKADELLNSALQEFQDPEEEKSGIHEKTIREEMVEFEERINDDPEIEAMFNELAEELESNSEIRKTIEKVGQDLFKKGVLKESMIDIRGRLSEYIQRNRHTIPKKELSRFEIQLSTYNEICEAIQENNEKSAMELISKLSLYGELPEELTLSSRVECVIT
ncbi:unnamed protein product [Blepharisma stoltei]|uniref:Uncharacterized protein n=1 Tax=Blepharisma stoltei TaxID=1481888 RepID=A0AAU9JK31_9CILI|nr:unnamed protein product [Blepharisma stoltei]